MVTLILAFEEPGRKPLSVATVRNADLLQQAALVALREAEWEAASAARENPMLGKLRAAEVVRLRTTPGALIPNLNIEAFPARTM